MHSASSFLSSFRRSRVSSRDLTHPGSQDLVTLESTPHFFVISSHPLPGVPLPHTPPPWSRPTPLPTLPRQLSPSLLCASNHNWGSMAFAMAAFPNDACFFILFYSLKLFILGCAASSLLCRLLSSCSDLGLLFVAVPLVAEQGL